MFFKKNLLLDISSFPVPSLAWKSYNRNLSSTHFALIHDLDNFALIWNIITTSTRICFLWPLIKCFLNFSCFLKLTSHLLQFLPELSFLTNFYSISVFQLSSMISFFSVSSHLFSSCSSCSLFLPLNLFRFLVYHISFIGFYLCFRIYFSHLTCLIH